MNEMIITIMEYVGTIAFSVSGALIAISCNLDIFGVVFVGVITAVGGGMLRDVLIGNCPPAIFSNMYVFSVAVFSAILVFIIAYINRKNFSIFREKIERINNIFDAIGLSAFTVTGTQIAIQAGYSDKILLVVLMGMTTGVGGGIFRDVLVSKIPYVLKKHVYALASAIGSLAYCIINLWFDGEFVGTVVAIFVIFGIRMFSTAYHWKLPKINI